MVRLSTGVEGLDEVLSGGLLAGRVYMVRGQPGAGKTTLGMQFLLEGARAGESVLFVTLSESEAELRENAELHRWDLAGVKFLDIHASSEGMTSGAPYSIFHPADVELTPISRRVLDAIDQLRPSRVVFDSLTQIRLLSRESLRYRREMLSLKTHLHERGITAFFLSDDNYREQDPEIESIVHGIISLSLSKGQEGTARRFIEVKKFRGSAFREGDHPLRLELGGLTVFPRLIAVAHGQAFERVTQSTGIAGLDAMLHGGFDRGTSTLITGNAGVGKTSVGMSVMAQAGAEGLRCAFYAFDEGPAEITYRSESIGMNLQALVDKDLLCIRKVNPLLLYPDEFARWIRVEVEQRGTRVVMIDSLNGYNQSMPDEKSLGRHMHQLIGYLNRMGVTTILINEVSSLVGDFSATQFGISYLADSVLILRYYEYAGAIHRAIGTLKKRLSGHESTLRSFHVSEQGLVVGEPLPKLRGILRGEAIWSDSAVASGDDLDA